MKCVKCNENTEAGRQYTFYYGKKLASHSRTSTQHQGSRAVTTTKTTTSYRIGGSRDSCLCNSCVLRGAVKDRIDNCIPILILSGLVIWGTLQFTDTALIALLFAGVFVVSVISTIIKVLKLSQVRRSSRNGDIPFDDYFEYDLENIGSSLAIAIHKKGLGTQLEKDDAFLTPAQYANLQ